MQSGYVGRVQSRLKSISPARARIIRGNLRRISREGERGRWYFLIASTTRQSRTEISVRGIDVRFEDGEREKKRRDSRGDGSCSCRLCDVFFFFLSFFCPPVFFTTKVNVTNGQRSIGPNDLVLSETRVLSPRCEEDRNPADGEIAGTGWSKVETFEGNG